MPSPGRGWTLTPEAFARLLSRRWDDAGSAAREYEALPRRLGLFSVRRGAAGPAALADEAMDRVARRLDEGEPIDQLRAYAAGVGRRMLLEDLKRRARERSS